MTTSEKTAADEHTLTREWADLLESLRRHRYFLRYTVRDLTDEQAAARPTVSALCLGGLIRHVAETEASWIRFVLDEPEAISGDGSDWNERFSIPPGATLAGLLEQYDEVARRTDELVATAPDLDESHPLPAHAGRSAGGCCTSSPRRPSMPDTPTSSARPWTAQKQWGEISRRAPAIGGGVQRGISPHGCHTAGIRCGRCCRRWSAGRW